MKKDTQINNSLKLNIFILLFLSNSSTYMLSSNSPIPVQKKLNTNKIERVDYITMRIQAELKTEFNTQKPVILVDKGHQTIIKNVFLLNQENKEDEFLESKTHYIVEIPNEKYALVSRMKKIEILPFNIEIKRKNKRKNYEVTF